jgi:probable Rubsico expression protein CbbX
MTLAAAQPGSVEALLSETRIHDVLADLDRDLVALAPVKARIREIASLLVVDRLRRDAGLPSPRPTLHMCFTGNPGTGKTTVALRMARILHRLGYVAKDRMLSVTRDDLVGQYVGHTAPKTREALKRAAGGVLFIDEAYALHRTENDRDYGQEAIEILLHVMEAERDSLVVVLAGYKDRMDAFFDSNPGFGSRVTHHIDFPDYSPEDLVGIAGRMLDDQAYTLSPAADRALREYIALRAAQPRFAHARSVRNALERARLRHAGRVMAAGGTPDRAALSTLEAEDFYGSRVFSRDASVGSPA